MSDETTRSEEARGPRILVLVAAETTRAIELPSEGTLTFGRADDVDIRVDHPSVSRHHARFHVGRDVAVEDLGSRNRTRVSGAVAPSGTRIVLRTGHVVECGSAMFVLRDAAEDGRSMSGEQSLVLARDGQWLEVARGERVLLGRRGALRRMLLALAERRLASPGTTMSVAELGEAGWPGDRARFDSVQARVYTSVQRLRAIGLAGVLVTRDDGYLLDPAVPLAWAR